MASACVLCPPTIAGLIISIVSIHKVRSQSELSIALIELCRGVIKLELFPIIRKSEFENQSDVRSDQRLSRQKTIVKVDIQTYQITFKVRVLYMSQRA